MLLDPESEKKIEILIKMIDDARAARNQARVKEIEAEILRIKAGRQRTVQGNIKR